MATAASEPLTRVAARHAPAEAREALARDDVEPALADVLARARAAWPGVSVPVDAYFEFLLARVPVDALVANPARALADARAADLYLACACARGDGDAARAFEKRYAHVVESVVARRADRELFADELRQRLLAHLFVADGGAPPRIAAYQGRGDLEAWVRVAVTRLMLNVLRGEKRRAAAHEAQGAEPVPIDDPELARIELHHRDDFRAALREAAAELTARERNLLRQHHVDGLTMDELAALYGLHRVTVIRALGAAREKLAEGTRRRLRERLRIDPSELDSLLRAVASKLELSIQRYLA